jgi:hypothetical protein
MVLVYMMLGVLILFYDVLPLTIGTTGKTIFGIIFLMYGIYRIYTLYASFKEQRDEE